MENIKNFKNFVNENNSTITKEEYVIKGDSIVNKDIEFYVNDNEEVISINKNRKEDEIEDEKIFFDKKESEDFKKELKNKREDVNFRIESK